MSVIDNLKAAGPTILPSMLLCDFANLSSEIERLEEAGVAALHLDIMDGVFVPNMTYGMTIVRAFRQATELPIDAHLMIVKPEKYVKDFCESGADIVTIHVESTDQPVEVLKQIRACGAAAGIAVNPDTPISSIEACLPHADLALVMSVHAGFGGQSFIPEVLSKFQEIRSLPGGEDILLEIDGGINSNSIQQAHDAGAELLVAGSAIFKNDDYRIAIEEMMNQLDFAS